MRRTFLVAFALSLASAACGGGTLGVVGSGAVGCDVSALTFTLDASLAISYEEQGASVSLALCFDAGSLDDVVAEVAASGVLAGAAVDVAASLRFDPVTAELSGSTAGVTLETSALRLAFDLVRQGDGFGATTKLAPVEQTVLDSITLGLNVDAFGEVQTQSCALRFTYAAADFAFSFGCAEVDATITFLETGFSELVLAAGNVGGLPVGITLGAQVQYAVDEKRAQVVPSVSLESPECFDLYAGLVWDEATRTLSGISLYAIGLAYEVDNVRVRGLWELDPPAIELVQEPYWALLGIVWDIAGCCGETGEGSMALFFGGAGLFSIGEVELGLEWPAAPGLELSLGVTYTLPGVTQITFGWRAEI